MQLPRFHSRAYGLKCVWVLLLSAAGCMQNKHKTPAQPSVMPQLAMSSSTSGRVPGLRHMRLDCRCKAPQTTAQIRIGTRSSKLALLQVQQVSQQQLSPSVMLVQCRKVPRGCIAEIRVRSCQQNPLRLQGAVIGACIGLAAGALRWQTAEQHHHRLLCCESCSAAISCCWQCW